MFTRATTLEQFAAIAALARTIWTEHYTPIIGTAQVDYMLSRFQSTAAIAEQVQQDGYFYYLVETTGSAIGYFAVQPRAETLFLSKIYVRSDRRGQGWGRTMMDCIEQLARDNRKSQITLTVNRHNAQSIAAYQKLGFENLGSVQTDIGSGFIMDDFCFAKQL
ncbi:MAG: GNAT family N-acetyltransferase [Spirulina sp. SIO3F2]|nr:GNAT family N-acetyltransferase [Spirulina sp. SIO3F2]